MYIFGHSRRPVSNSGSSRFRINLPENPEPDALIQIGFQLGKDLRRNGRATPGIAATLVFLHKSIFAIPGRVDDNGPFFRMLVAWGIAFQGVTIPVFSRIVPTYPVQAQGGAVAAGLV